MPPWLTGMCLPAHASESTVDDPIGNVNGSNDKSAFEVEDTVIRSTRGMLHGRPHQFRR